MASISRIGSSTNRSKKTPYHSEVTVEMSRLFGLVLLLVVSVFAIAQSALQPAPTDTTTIRVTSRIVYVDITVRDKSGHMVHGLTQQDFKLEEDGKLRRLISSPPTHMTWGQLKRFRGPVFKTSRSREG